MDNSNINFGDREILDDVLSDQKSITGVYNTYSNECVNPQLQSDFLDILHQEHDIQYSVFEDMHRRGWYEPAKAEVQKVNEAKTKFEGVATQL